MKKTIVRRTCQTAVSFSDDIPLLLQRIYQNRGIKHADEIDTQLSALLPYTTLLNIDKAVDLLVRALQQQQRLLILGDFDVDGATSTALAVRALQAFGARHVHYLVPNRFTYGYGLTPEIVAVAATYQPNVLITVDNGIASHSGVLAAKAREMTVIITDHHLPGASLPEADAIVNPNQPEDHFPSKVIAGVGVIFYVMLALRGRLRDIGWFEQQQLATPSMAQFLDLVALGTVADVVPLDRNNRILISQGLRRIRAQQCCLGIQALLKIARRDIVCVTAADLGFAIGPRLNAAGRLEDMSQGIACLLATDWPQAQAIAAQLDTLNKERRDIEAAMLAQANTILDQLLLSDTELPPALCLYEPTWHQGIIGILAGRIKDRYYRPVIVFAKANDEELKGSARSTEGIHIRDILADIAAANPMLISKFGGHAMAAGLTLPLSHYAEFCTLFTEAVARQADQQNLRGAIFSDGELIAPYFTVTTAEQLREHGPWGQGFPEPLFDGYFEVVQQRIVADKHLKFLLKPKNTSLTLEAIAFNHAALAREAFATIQAVFRLETNDYGGEKKLQLVIEHLEPVLCEG